MSIGKVLHTTYAKARRHRRVVADEHTFALESSTPSGAMLSQH
jgi:hypothetical protein